MSEIDEYLEPYAPEIRDLCEKLRALIKATIPGVQEKLLRGWQLIGYRTPPGAGGRYFLFIAPYAGRVRLGFEWGVLLADEEDLLKDKGTQVRSLYFSDTADLQPELLPHYILEAAEVAALSKGQKANLALQREAEQEWRGPAGDSEQWPVDSSS